MNKRSNVYSILIVFLLLIQQIISGCTTTVTKDLPKESLFKEEIIQKGCAKGGLNQRGFA